MTGVALVEVYDLGAGAESLSSTSDALHCADGRQRDDRRVHRARTQSKRVIIRAIGPELAQLNTAYQMCWLIRHWSCTMALGFDRL